ncbi:hypothetical protein BDZ97DRAFT_2070656 [Flammula alnicola]|nr:hypothetical protein BDZ97DRAFT_2070656 [Flammula alnicola]
MAPLSLSLTSSDGDRFSQRHHLQTCALLCRAFLPRSQHHLFSSIKLTAGRVHEFYEILQRTPSIAGAVRTLHLVFYDGRCDWMVDGGGAEFVYILTSITQPTTSTSTLLCKLKLEGQRPSGSSIKSPQLFLERVFKPFLARFITSLHIETLANVPIDVIDSCVRLTELALVCASLKYGHTHTHTQSSPPRHKLRRLEYTDSGPVKQLTTQTRSRLDLSELRSLYVHMDSLSEATFEQWVIDESAGALEELCFKNFDDPQSQLRWFIDLKACSNLRILNFDVNLGHPTPGAYGVDLHTLSRVLSTLPKSTSLDTLRLTAYVGYVWTVDDPQDILNGDWAGLQSRLADIAAGKAFFEFAFRVMYMNANDEEDEGEGMGERCRAALDRLLTEKLDLLAKHPCISVVNLGHYVDTPHES